MRFFARREAMMMAVIIVIIMVMMVIVMCLSETFFAVEYEEIHAEGIERGDENTCQNSKVCETRTSNMRGVNSLDNAVFRIET